MNFLWCKVVAVVVVAVAAVVVAVAAAALVVLGRWLSGQKYLPHESGNQSLNT